MHAASTSPERYSLCSGMHESRNEEGGVVTGECLTPWLVNKVRCPILIGDGIPSFVQLDADVALHLAEV